MLNENSLASSLKVKNIISFYSYECCELVLDNDVDNIMVQCSLDTQLLFSAHVSLNGRHDSLNPLKKLYDHKKLSPSQLLE